MIQVKGIRNKKLLYFDYYAKLKNQIALFTELSVYKQIQITLQNN